MCGTTGRVENDSRRHGACDRTATEERIVCLRSVSASREGALEPILTGAQLEYSCSNYSVPTQVVSMWSVNSVLRHERWEQVRMKAPKEFRQYRSQAEEQKGSRSAQLWRECAGRQRRCAEILGLKLELGMALTPRVPVAEALWGKHASRTKQVPSQPQHLCRHNRCQFFAL
jgi:hypothetical protein